MQEDLRFCGSLPVLAFFFFFFPPFQNKVLRFVCELVRAVKASAPIRCLSSWRDYGRMANSAVRGNGQVVLYY